MRAILHTHIEFSWKESEEAVTLLDAFLQEMTIICNYIYLCFTYISGRCHKKRQTYLGYKEKFYMCNIQFFQIFVYIYTPLNGEPQGSSSDLRAPEVDAGSLKYSSNLN